MNYEDIKKLIEDMGNSKIDALDIEFSEGTKISMKKNSVEVKETQISNVSKICQSTNIEEKETKKKEEAYLSITSPMVGTFYDRAEPKANPFVKVGDHVKKGDVVCIIEAMKLMNEIEADIEGEIIEVCTKNEEAVDYGRVLFKIK